MTVPRWIPARRVRIALWISAALGMAVWMALRPHQPGLVARKAPPTKAGRTRVKPPAAEVVEFLKTNEPAVSVGRVTYADHIAPILREKCQACHRPGQVAPFSLGTYDQACRWKRGIREVVLDRRMPPWHADPRHGTFANDRGLSPAQRAAIVAWVDQGTPLGDPDAIPEPVAFPDGWTIGTPDAVFTMTRPFTVPAQGVLSYQRFRVPTNFQGDVWVQALEARPGDRRVVHHICIYLEGKTPNDEGRAERPELVCYAPGDLPSVFPKGTAKLIPAGASLVFEVHYTPIGVAKADQSSVGLIFARDPVRRRAVTKGISNKNLVLPPGAKNHELRSSFTFPFDARLLSLSPHLHLRGKDFQYRATYPDGRAEILLSVPAYDFAWQSVYRLAVPKTMPHGTRIDCVAHFDNSADNPNNPDPTAEVRWGDQTWDEMMIGYIDYDVIEPRALAGRPAPGLR
ncbi:MAG: Copper type ascorbate-dependent monooxygenase, C-terminal domain protein [Planctomycetota bacterium]|nr:Copper type ascorbate-dependent monooxygenase, C-terminal domain protein [Planctomycetota bacterium]